MGELIDDGQHPQRTPFAYSVVHEVQRPLLSGPRELHHGNAPDGRAAGPLCAAALGAPADTANTRACDGPRIRRAAVRPTQPPIAVARMVRE